MKITVTQFKHLAADPGNPATPWPLPGGYNGNQIMSALGAAEPMASGTRLVRIGTDTAVLAEFYGPGSGMLIVAGGELIWPVATGDIITFVAA